MAYIKQKHSEIGVTRESKMISLSPCQEHDPWRPPPRKSTQILFSVCSANLDTFHALSVLGILIWKLGNANGIPASVVLMVKWDDTQYRCLEKLPTTASAYLRGL